MCKVTQKSESESQHCFIELHNITQSFSCQVRRAVRRRLKCFLKEEKEFVCRTNICNWFYSLAAEDRNRRDQWQCYIKAK